MARPPLPIGTWGEISVSGESGRWRASARYRGRDGRTRTYSRWRKTKGAARQALLDHFAGMQDADRTGDLTPESRVSALLEHWMTGWESAQPRKPATVRTYRRAVQLATERVGGLRVMESTTARLDGAVRGVREAHGIETGRQVGNVLRQAFAHALRLGVVPANPALGVSTVRAQRDPVRAMTAEEVQALREAAKRWEAEPVKGTRPWVKEIATAIDVMLGTGVRIGELLAIRWQDLDLSTVPASVSVGGTVTRALDGGMIRQEAPKSEASQRTLYLPHFVTRELREWRKDREAGPDDPVFPSQWGRWRDPSGFRRDFRAVREIAGLTWVTPHTIRKTVATQVYRADGLAHAGGQLGHAEVGVTSQHYVERVNAGPVEVVALLDAFVEGV